MKLLLGSALVASLIFFTGCGGTDDNTAFAAEITGSREPASTPPAPVPKPRPATPKPTPPDSRLDGAIAWGAERASWSRTVRNIVKARFSEFNRAQDKEHFCPGYGKASQAEKENCFVALVAAIAKFECNFRPGLSFKEPDGNYSVGLLMLSRGECKNAPSVAALKDPIQNLICGTNKMAALIGRDNMISGRPGSYGAAAYWSTLRPPYKKGKYKLGKKSLIQAITKAFKGSGKSVVAMTAFDTVDYPLYYREDEAAVWQMLEGEDQAMARESGWWNEGEAASYRENEDAY